MTSVPQEHTTAVVTPHATTPKDHTCAVVYPAILETGNFAKVKYMFSKTYTPFTPTKHV